MKKEADTSAAERVERRAVAKRNPQETSGEATLRAQTPYGGLARVRATARGDRKIRFTALLHHITPELLEEAYYKLNRHAGVGVDGRTWKSYGKGLRERLVDLHGRIHRGSYRARPSKRIWIPKADGRQRPIGIASLEDKIVQQALVWVLESIYESAFKGFSYGFRPHRSQHNALDAIYVAITQRKVSWIVDADIKGFFDNINHDWMMRFLEHRIGDKRILRLVKKFLRAGVSEEGEWSSTEVGTPQGSVISPVLANIYLHYVLDLWIDAWRGKCARGEIYIVRYADDFVIACQYRSDAEACLKGLNERMGKFGLSLHPEKTRLIEFGRFAQSNRAARGEGKPESFDFLGFTHLCSRRSSDGKYALRRITIRKRLRRKVDELKVDLRKRMHESVAQTGAWLRSVVRGFNNYHGIPGNQKAQNAFRSEVCRKWIESLRRRSQKNRYMAWGRCRRLFATWIPSVKITHPYPNQRLIV